MSSAPSPRDTRTDRRRGGGPGGRRGGSRDRGHLAATAAAVASAALWLYVAGLQGACRADRSLERIQEAGLLRVGYAVEAPYAFLDAQGEVTGESPETARRVAERMGVPRLVWVQDAFDHLVRDLLDRRFDVIAAGLFVTPERQRQVAFTPPTVQVLPGFLVPGGNPRGLSSSAGIARDPAVRVAALSGSVEAGRMVALGVTSPRLIEVPDPQTGRAAVESGAADAFALSLPTLRWLAGQSGGRLSAIPDDGGADVPTPDHVAFAFHPEDRALREAWVDAMAGFIGTPQHLELIQGFGFAVDSIAASGSPGSRP